MRVSGKVAPDILKPAPVIVPALMVSGAVPEEVRVTDCGVAAVFTMTLPKARLPVLSCRAGVGVGVGLLAISSRAKVLESVPEVAVKVVGCVVVTDAMVAGKAALVALAGMVTVAGSVTAASLLERLTLSPPLPAAALRVTVQESVPEPVIERLAQESALSVLGAIGATVPVPLRLITANGSVAESLTNVSCPVTALAAEGSKPTFRVAVCP